MHAKAKIMENIPLLGSWCQSDTRINLGKKVFSMDESSLSNICSPNLEREHYSFFFSWKFAIQVWDFTYTTGFNVCNVLD